MRDHILGRSQARRLSRRFAGVGVEIPPPRLRAMLSGAPIADHEMTDVNFALIAIQINREKRLAKLEHLRRQCRQALISVGLAIVALNFLVCIAYLFFTMTQQSSAL
jgi:hypothetical protein